MGIQYLLKQDRFVAAQAITGLWEIPLLHVRPKQEELVEAVEVVKPNLVLQLLQAVLVALVL